MRRRDGQRAEEDPEEKVEVGGEDSHSERERRAEVSLVGPEGHVT